jgi:hypothetical protein
MRRYQNDYDFGLRGYPQTARRGWGAFRDRYGEEFRRPFDERAFPEQRLSNRVSARYNLDYVMGHQRNPYDRQYNMYTGDRPQRIGDARYMRHPYITSVGTWTMRGSTYPTGYDYPDYGPNYGGRYPDEL